MRYIALLFFMFVLVLSVRSQELTDIQFLDQYIINYVEKGEKLPTIYYQTHHVSPEIFEKLQPYFSSNDEKIRYRMFSVIYAIGWHTEDIRLKTQAMENLITAVKDSSISIRRYFSEKLSSFELRYYHDDFKDKFKLVLEDEKYVNSDLILLSGFLNLVEEKNFLKSFITDPQRHINKWSLSPFKSFRWSSMLALTRMGDNDYISTIIDTIKNQSGDDIVLKRFRDLAYTRNKNAISYIASFLNDDRVLPRGDYGEPGQPYSSLAIWHLSSIIDNFPVVNRNIYWYTEEEKIMAIQWMKQNAESYRLLNEKF